MAARMPDVGDHVGRYRLTGVLGRGGMGTVFEAQDDALERRVALKVINPAIAAEPEYRERFRREAIAMSRLDSPHVLTVHDHGEQDGTPYLVTQLVTGGDLEAEVRRGPLAPGRALELTRQVLDGLADAHAAGIVHRDIKPSNVLLGGDKAYLCDFGIATSPDAALTRTGVLMGSIAYMAPERHSGENATNAGPAGDIYAVGCLLWAMLTGTPPYAGSDVEVAMGHLHGALPQLPERDAFTAGINEVLLRALAKDPARRYATARAMRAAAAGLLSQAPAAIVLPDVTSVRQPLTVPPAAPPAEERRRRPLPAALMASLAVLGVILGVVGIVLAAQRPSVVTALTGEHDTSSAGGTSSAASAPTSPTSPGGKRARHHKHARPGAATSVATVPPATAVLPHLPAPPKLRESWSPYPQATSRPTAASSPAAPTTSSAPPPPAYTCWNGTPAAGPGSCGYPHGLVGLRWMTPNRQIGCKPTQMSSTDQDLEDWICRYDGGRSWVTIIRWKSWQGAADMYAPPGGWQPWTCGTARCGLSYQGPLQKMSSYIRVYQVQNYWSVAIRARTATMRNRGRELIGALRGPGEIQGKPTG
ncbi:serine/threonine-protein kinase [Nocardioides montaniterrae]